MPYKTKKLDGKFAGTYKEFVKQQFAKRPAGTCVRAYMKEVAAKWKEIKGGAIAPYDPFKPYVPKPGDPGIPPIPGPHIVNGIPRTRKQLKGGFVPKPGMVNPIPVPKPVRPGIPKKVLDAQLPLLEKARREGKIKTFPINKLKGGALYTDWESQYFDQNEDQFVENLDKYGKYIQAPGPAGTALSALKKYPRQIIGAKQVFNNLLRAGTFF